MFGEFVHTVQRIAKNTFVTIIGNIVFRFISLVITICLARYLGTADFGKYSFVFAYLVFFTVLADFGLRQLLVREMSRNRSLAPKLMGNTWAITLLLTIFATVLSMIIITLMPYPSDITTYVYIAALTIVSVSFSEFYSTIFQVDFKMEYIMFAKITSKILSAILILWIIFSKGTLTLILISVAFSETIRMLLNYSFSKKFIRPKIEIDFELYKYLLKQSLPLALLSVIWIIYFRIDVIMLSSMVGDTSVGIYSAAYHLSEPLSLIPSAVMISLFPIMSSAFKTSEKKLTKSYGLGIKYLLIIILPFAIGTALLAEKIIFLIYGPEFSGSSTALQILMCAFIFASLNSVSLNLLVSTNRQKLTTLIIGLCAIINIALNFIMIPMLNYNGAAIATVASNIVIFILSFYFVSNYLVLS
ncbi:MAG: flippase [Methanosarcinaceae archaeon]